MTLNPIIIVIILTTNKSESKNFIAMLIFFPVVHDNLDVEIVHVFDSKLIYYN